MMTKKRRLELLAPARNYDVAIEAVNCGADAVYMGAEGFGARSAACNSMDDVARVVQHAHRFGVKVYVTFNTLIYDDELSLAEAMIRRLYGIGVDALIVQDMGILRMDIPPIELHASTQCDIRTPEKAAFLESLGFSQLVLARELSKEEIQDVRRETHVRLEAFVHGALCVSYSGRCQVSQVLKGRSANRGECAQICRLPFDLVDGDGNVIVRNKHFLSLRDMNLSRRLDELVDAGVDSFKIEGRLKDAGYVKNVVAYYRRAIDEIIQANPDKYERASYGISQCGFTPNLSKSFNRSFTHYYFDARNLANGVKIASIGTPKSIGERLGKVVKCEGKKIVVSSSLHISNGDGISYFDRAGEYAGFRVNRVEGNVLFLPQIVNIPAGTVLYRTFDKEFEDGISTSKSERKLWVDFDLRIRKNLVVLDAQDERGNSATCCVEAAIEQSETPQDARQRDTLSKTGNTVYMCRNVKTVGNMFVPQSILAKLRRQALEILDRVQRINYRYGYRLPEKVDAPCFSSVLTYADNVANSLARQLYRDHGVKETASALEAGGKTGPDCVVMHTRYCLRRELGICLKSEVGRKSPRELLLRHGKTELKLEFDCNRCEMHVKIKK